MMQASPVSDSEDDFSTPHEQATEETSLIVPDSSKSQSYQTGLSSQSESSLAAPNDGLTRRRSVSRQNLLNGSLDSLAHGPAATLSWQGINVYVRLKAKSWLPWRRGKEAERASSGTVKQILHNVNGIVYPGQLVALMGTSGAGKTTLMNSLANRNKRNTLVDGQILVNGDAMGDSITSISAYVQQDDIFIGTLTVREHLVFQALLRLPSEISIKQKIRRVDIVISELGLVKCRNTKIGIAGMLQGISGGEAKRLAFASEILTDPSILFCDEPTTGLDSHMAENVVSVLQSMVAKGKTILCTIHQPPSEVYRMFDRIILLADSGRNAFYGSPQAALDFFERCGYPCPDDFNPPDHYIQMLAILPGREEESRKTVQEICQKFDDSVYNGELQQLINSAAEMQSYQQDDIIMFRDHAKSSKFKVNWLFQFVILLWRSTLNNLRNTSFAFALILQRVVIGLFCGLAYNDTANDQTSIMNINGALYFYIIEISYSCVMGIISFFPKDYSIVCRESNAGMYRVSSYYASKIVSLMPFYSTDTVIFVSMSYWLIGLQPTATAFLTTIGLCVLMEQAACAFGCLAGASTPNFAVAITVVAPVMIVLNLSGGLFVNIKTLPAYIQGFQYLSWFRYGFESLAVNQWTNVVNISCYAGNQTAQFCIETGDEVIRQELQFNPDSFAMDIWLMAALFFCYHLLGCLALMIRVSREH